MLVDAGYRFTDSEMILAHWFTLDLPRSGSRLSGHLGDARCSDECHLSFVAAGGDSFFGIVILHSYQFISVHIIFSFYSHSFSTSIIQRVTSQTSSMSPLFVRFGAAFSAETEIHAGFAVRSRTCGTRSSKSLGRMLNITIFGTTK